ncbi:transposase [Ensifer aridi]|uniref:transposase n=1 Tax=Ensifer aridi TaxID=1708715 RepID=UPI00358E4C7F
MGRSRGGLTSKIHALVDAEGRPVNLRLTGGRVADCTEADALTDEFGEGDILLADKGYDSNAIRAKAAERKAWANIPPKAHSRAGFTGRETSWSGSLTRSNSSEASPRATTSDRKTTSPPSSSSRPESGARVYESTPLVTSGSMRTRCQDAISKPAKS